MVIRKANHMDIHGIANVHIRSWKETYKGIIKQDYLDNLKVDDRIPLWSQVLADGDSIVYVAEDLESKIVGFASFGVRRPLVKKTDGELYAMYILEDYHRKGLGKLLFENGLHDLQVRGITSLSVWVLADNPSRSFYESFSPLKVKSETIRIGDSLYKEDFYEWPDLNELAANVMKRNS